jgi:hypothetical protein
LKKKGIAVVSHFGKTGAIKRGVAAESSMPRRNQFVYKLKQKETTAKP